MNFLKILSFLFLTFVISHPSLATEPTKRNFKNWRASCDGVGNCNGLTTARADNGSGAIYTLKISRRAASSAFWELSFTLQGEELRNYEPLHISIDFESPVSLKPDDDYRASAQASRYSIIGISPGNRLMDLFAIGNEAYFNFLNARAQETAAHFSLNGLSATLLWIDDQQNRLNSARAIGEKSPRTAQPQSNASSQFTSGNTVVSAPQKLPVALRKLHMADGECDPIDTGLLVSFGFETAPLEENKTLFIVPCFAGAYNIKSRLYTHDDSNKPPYQQLLFAHYSEERRWTEINSLTNVDYDAKTKELATFSKARGLGDCGSTSQYQWTGDIFKLIEYRYWNICDSTRLSDDWPVIFPPSKSSN